MNPAFSDLQVLYFVGEHSEEEIAEIESHLPSPLPPDFVAFLEAVNGSYLPYEIEIDLGQQTEVLEFCSVYSTKTGLPHRDNLYFIDRLMGVRRDLGGICGGPQ